MTDPTESPDPAARDDAPRVFLFLQGPASPFFPRLAAALEGRGHRCLRVNLCAGDKLFWRRPGALDYRGRPEDWPGYVAALMDREKVSDLVLLGEQRDHHRTAIAAAKDRGIAVTVTDFGYLRPDWITLEKDGMSGNSRFPRDPEEILALAGRAPPPDLTPRYREGFWTMALRDMAYHLSTSFLWPFYPHYRSFLREMPVLGYMGTGYRMLRARLARRRTERLIDAVRGSGAPYYVFPLQMETDFQIRAYSPFDDHKEPIRLVIESFARKAPPDSRLMIKVHPFDSGRVNWRSFTRGVAAGLGVAGRVDCIDGGSLDALLERARGVVTINSTVGLWALRADRPLKVLGQAVFDLPGLSFDGPLDRFWDEGAAPDPELRDAFIRALAATTQIRGVFYSDPGLDHAVEAAAERLDRGLVNRLLPESETAAETSAETKTEAATADGEAVPAGRRPAAA